MGTFITAKSGFSNIKSSTVDVTVTRGRKIRFRGWHGGW